MATLYEKRTKGRKDPPDAVYLAELEPPAKGRRIVFDTHKDAPKGFGCRVTSNGTVAFVLRYTNEDGQDKLLTVGRWPTPWSLAAARKDAEDKRRGIDQGADPITEKRARRAAPTVKEAVRRYITAHVERTRSAEDTRRYFDVDILPALGDMKVGELRRRDVVALVEAKALTAPRAARAVLGHLKHFLSWCELREIIEVSPAHGIKPAAVDRTMKPKKRGRVLDDAEIRAFWNHKATIHRLTDLALRLVLVTGQRPGEVAGMAWSAVNGNVWTIPASRRGKTEDDHVVPLTDTAMGIIEQARAEVARLKHRRKATKGAFVFEMAKGEPITTRALTRAVTRYRDRLGNKEHATWGHWTPHDLRRTARTGMAAAGVIREIAERVVGHVQPGIVGNYDMHKYHLEKRAALEAWERRLLRIIAGQKPGDEKVVSIAEARA